jgi:hypothetical protein
MIAEAAEPTWPGTLRVADLLERAREAATK